jgi:hypothetical protein
MSDQLVAETSTRQQTTLTTDRHPHPRRNSNPLRGRAAAKLCLGPRGYWDRWILCIVFLMSVIGSSVDLMYGGY